ncbi:MAG TPA: NERD domain-containing protein/DEAD/DEAH box helicase [Usitatibacter sp.]|jgi:hypothetical protein|nr:NERD domain-containing protein/DEAD/DEAH box helicase [Usitatibacter sp.]
MARIHPENWQALAAEPAVAREVATLEVLAQGLPDEYSVFHGVHWTRLTGKASQFTLHGEIDFAIVAPSGRMLLIEQKSGALQETQEGLAKKYKDKTKLIAPQMARTCDHFVEKFKETHRGARPSVEMLLYCPDHRVVSTSGASIDPARIVDATKRDRLCEVIKAILPLDDKPVCDAEDACKFLASQLELVPAIGQLIGNSKTHYTRLAGGLAEWGMRLEFSPFRLRVVGTAGSGKTQLALRVLRDAAETGRPALYVCFNRPLADQMREAAPEGVDVCTYHQLCERYVRSIGETPDFSKAGAFRAMEQAFGAATLDASWSWDEVVIDEGQDFEPAWADSLVRLVREGGRAWWLEDPMQNLYRRAPARLDGWTVLRSDTNYRSPRDVLDHLNQLLPLERSVEGGSPIGGSDVEFVTYSDQPALFAQTRAAIDRALALRFRPDMIAVVTFRGREQSAFTPFDRLGSHSLRCFTGSYDLNGNPIFNDGDITLESVYRFKGQSAPCIIFTEIDFDCLDEKAVRKLFVGATRATHKLLFVVSERAAGVLLHRLG